MDTKLTLIVDAFHKSGVEHHFDAEFEVTIPMQEFVDTMQEKLYQSLDDPKARIQIGDCIIRIGDYSAFRVKGELGDNYPE